MEGEISIDNSDGSLSPSVNEGGRYVRGLLFFNTDPPDSIGLTMDTARPHVAEKGISDSGETQSQSQTAPGTKE